MDNEDKIDEIDDVCTNLGCALTDLLENGPNDEHLNRVNRFVDYIGALTIELMNR